MIRQQIELSLKYFPFIVSQFLRREKKFCKTELLNDLILKEWFLQGRKHHHDFQLMQASTETFRCEKSAWNGDVSGTREFWNFRFKTKSWNFFEVRWRPHSPKESF